MSEPFVFISKHKIKEGKFDGFKDFFLEGVELLEANKPQTVFFGAYVSEDASEVSIVHVFPDTAAMELHMQGASDRSKKAYEFLEPRSFEFYGTPSSGILEMMKQVAGSGAAVSIKPQQLGGFIRLKSG